MVAIKYLIFVVFVNLKGSRKIKQMVMYVYTHCEIFSVSKSLVSSQVRLRTPTATRLIGLETPSIQLSVHIVGCF